MGSILIVLGAAILLAGVLYFENQENRQGLVPTKTLLSFLFILVVLISPHRIPRYTRFLLIGLGFCLGGDFFLALPQRKMFVLGLVSFLLGNVFYIFAFQIVTNVNAWTWIGSSGALIISGCVYFWLRPHLGPMHGPVLLYIIAITLMLSGASSVFGNSNLNPQGRIMVLVGALSFYFSDVFVARDRFLKKAFFNRLVGLPMYYTGQFLLAFSVGSLRLLG
ncbi:MAG: lysoplasmalogenase [Desulfobacteraceae bacterium]|jgi:uncharacterized membrane protein YhhN